MKIQDGPFTEMTLREMVRAKFWSGLHSSEVRNATRHHFESGLSYDELIVKARIVENEHQKKVDVSVVQNVPSPLEQKLDVILKRLSVVEAELKKPSEKPQASSQKPQTSDSRTASKRFEGDCFFCHKRGHRMGRCFRLQKLQQVEKEQQRSRSEGSTNQNKKGN